MILNEQISRLRKEKKLTQEELAEKCNVSRQAVAKWEGNESVPDLSNIICLADIFNVSLDYLIKGESEKKKMDVKSAEKFIEVMSEVGENWTVEQVLDVYGNVTLEEAVEDREKSFDSVVKIIQKVIGNGKQYKITIDREKLKM